MKKVSLKGYITYVDDVMCFHCAKPKFLPGDGYVCNQDDCSCIELNQVTDRLEELDVPYFSEPVECEITIKVKNSTSN